MEGAAATYRCARCGVESAERSCFVFLRRRRDPSRNIRCVQCVLAMSSSRVLVNTYTVLLTFVGPFIYMCMGAWDDGLKVPVAVQILFGCVAYPVALVAHEAAHALTGILVGLELGGVGFGFGRVVWRFQVRGLPIQLHAWPLSGRVYLGCETLSRLRARVWVTTLMGPLTNVLLALAVAAWWKPLASVMGPPAASTWILVNAAIAFFNLIPRQGAGIGGNSYRSDGLALLQIPRAPDSELHAYRISALMVRALIRLEVEDFMGAQFAFEQAMQRAPDNPLVVLGLSACKISLGQYSEGRELLAPLLERPDLGNPLRVMILNNTAFALALSQGFAVTDIDHWSHADLLSGEVMNLFPCVLEYRTTRALVLAGTQRPEQALLLLDYMNYAKGKPRQSSMREAVRAFALRKLGRAEEAERAAALALRLSPGIRQVLEVFGFTPASDETQLRLFGSPVPAWLAWLRGVPSSLKEEMRQASESFHQPQLLDGANSALARIAGAILAVFGGGMGAGLLLLIYRLAMTPDDLDRTTLIVMAGLLGLAAFCLSLGYRLVLNRPNRHGSLLSPWAWRVMSGGFLILTLMLAKIFLFHTPPAPNPGLLLAPLLFAAGCWMAGRAAQRSRA